MQLLHRWLSAAGLAGLAAALLLLVVPVSGAGLSGPALHPHAGAFGWYAYSPLPTDPTDAQLRAAGVRTPSAVLDHRRRKAAEAAASAVGLLGAGLLVRRRRDATSDGGATAPGAPV